MSLPSNGITADVIRDIMPPYHLSFDLLKGTFRTLPPPPPDASVAWRHKRITRLIGEITALKPADASQARTAAQVLSLRELADTVISRATTPEVTLQQLCRLGRTAAEVARTAAGLVRGLERTQQKPVPFYGTVVEDEVDVTALDGVWGRGPARRLPPGTCPGGEDADAPGGHGDLTAGAEKLSVAGSGLVVANSGTGDGPVVMDAASDDRTAVAEGQSGDDPETTDEASGDTPVAMAGRQGPAGEGPDAGSTFGSVVTRLDQGPGWTLDAVRRRTGGDVDADAAPRVTA